MTADVRRLIERCFQSGDRLYIGEAISAAGIARALALHGAALERDEVPLLIYDDTLFGDSSDGFVVTAKRLCWKNLMEHPRQLRWCDFEADEVRARDGDVQIGEHLVQIHAEDVRAQLTAFLSAAAAGERAEQGYFSPRAIVRLAQKHMAANTDVFYTPSIPARKLQKAAGVHGLRTDDVLVLYDDTLFGSAEDGFVFSQKGLHWKNFTESPSAVTWRDIDVREVAESEGGYALAELEICIAQANKYGAGAAAAVRAITWLAQEGDTARYIELTPEAPPTPEGVERCPYCRVKNPTRATYCQGCGAPV